MQAAAKAGEERGEIKGRGLTLCERGDLGPFPCLEAGCEASGVAVSCDHLARDARACARKFSDVWTHPQLWSAAMRVREACPIACGLCADVVDEYGRYVG